MPGSSSPSDNYSVINFSKVVSSKPVRNDGASEIYGNAGAGSRVTNTPGASIFGSVNKVVNHVPYPNDVRASGYNRATWAVSGQPYGIERPGFYLIDRYSTKIGNVTTTVMSSPSKGLNGRQSIYGTIAAVSSPWVSGGFNYLNGQWLINTSTASGYNMQSVSGNAPVDQALHVSRQNQSNVVFTVGKTAIHQAYLSRSE